MCALVIIVINQVLRYVVRYLSVKERNDTYTEYNLSVAFKLFVVRFLNTAIVPVIVSANTDNWFINGGLVSNFFSIMISFSFTSPIT